MVESLIRNVDITNMTQTCNAHIVLSVFMCHIYMLMICDEQRPKSQLPILKTKIRRPLFVLFQNKFCFQVTISPLLVIEIEAVRGVSDNPSTVRV